MNSLNNKEDLIKELEEFYKIESNYEQKKYSNDQIEAYLIYKPWFENWKKYVNYEDYKRKAQINSKNFNFKTQSEYYPGEINNNNLLVDPSNFYNDGNMDDIENIVVKSDINQREELKIIDKEIWDFFVNRYGGGPVICKPMIEEDNGRGYKKRKVFEVYYAKLMVFIIPLKRDIKSVCKDLKTNQNLNANNFPKIFCDKMLFIKKSKNIIDLKQKLIDVAIKPCFADNDNENIIKNNTITTDNIRLWRYTGNLSKEEFIKFVNNNKQDVLDDKQLNISNILSYCEFEKDAGFDSIEVENTDTLVVEVNFDIDENSQIKKNSISNTEDNNMSVSQNQDNKNYDINKNWLFELKKIEIKKTKCDWCNNFGSMKIACVCKEVWYCSDLCKQRDRNYHENNCKKQFEIEQSKLTDFNSSSRKGLVGLQNLGNTCFMNTSLQCIANCYELSMYFLKDYYKKDINVDNPIGTQGVLAHSYATLVKNLYYGDNQVYVPRNFKRAIATFQSMFTGYQQHDTQEFLNYLLDGLHEDLNRVLKKPLVSKDESKNVVDSVKSKNEWIGFLRRNQSVLVDLLYGQYKSTITCPCSNISTTFDPFLSISLPLPHKVKPYDISCYFIFYDTSIIPLHLTILFNVKTNVMSLRNKIANIINIHPFSFVICKMNNKGCIEYLCNTNMNIQSSNNYMHSNQLSYFIFQINPELFNNKSKYAINCNTKNFNENFSNILNYLDSNIDSIKSIIENEKTEEIEKDSSYNETVNYYSTSNYSLRSTNESAIIKYSNDNNYGFDSQYILSEFLQYSEKETSINGRIRIIFPRLLYISTKTTILNLYKYVFNYFYKLICNNDNIDISKTNQTDLFESSFGNLIVKNYENNSINNTNIPFKLYINSYINENQMENNRNFFGDQTYKNEGFCYLDLNGMSDKILEDFVNLIPKNSNNKSVDNTFKFMSDSNKFYSNLSNRDIYFLILWNKKYEASISNLNEKHDYNLNITKKYKSSIDIDECFRKFTKEEELDKGNSWYCPSCKEHTMAKVHMEIYNTPPILIIHLKRFYRNQKIDALVDFPLNNFDVKNYIIKGNTSNDNVQEIGYGYNSLDCTKYDLFAVAHHYGGMGGGHYVASAKNYFDNKWYNFNDSGVSMERDPTNVVDSSAYVLFYKRKDIDNLNLENIYNKRFINYEEYLNSQS